MESSACLKYSVTSDADREISVQIRTGTSNYLEANKWI